MAEIERLKKMVLKLPVSDLQTILDYAGRRKVGKKRDLQARIIGLLHQPLAGRVKKKIREVYESPQWRDKRTQESDDDDDDDTGYERVPCSKNSLPPFLSHQQGTWDDSMNIFSAYNMLMDHQRKSKSPRGSLYPYPGFLLDKQAFTASTNVMPNVQLKKLPFYEPIAVLLEPTSLLPKNNRRVNEASFLFHLTPQQATDVISSFTIEPEIGKASYVIQVQLRFCRLETFEQHDDCFPPSVSVRVNGKVCALPAATPTNTVGMEPKRPPRPVDLTPYLQVSPDVANRVDVTWNPMYGHVHVVTVILVKKLTSEELLDQLRAKGFREADYTRRLIKTKMSEESGGEIAAMSLRVSLACPLGKTRLTLPCRSTACTHLQCFDAAVFLNMNELRPTWQCPVCGQPCPYDTLLLDGYFHELLSSGSLPKCVMEIQVDEDGAWSPYVKEEPQSTTSKSAQEFVLEEISFDDIEVISMKPVANKPKKASRSEILVDLTNSDSDESSSSSSDDESPNSDDEQRELTELRSSPVKSQPGTSSEPISVSGTGESSLDWDNMQSESTSDSSVILIDLT